MNWSSTLSWEDAKKRAYIVNKIRSFFVNRKVVEVETPLLCHSTVTDVHLEAFKTSFRYFPHTTLDIDDNLYLQTSPEFSMKRLLASGYESIFQISKAFRHESKGRFHNPEFTILEWYRLNFSHLDLIKEVAELLKEIIDCKEPKLISYQKLFLEHLDIDPLTVNIKLLKKLIIQNDRASDWILEECNKDILLQFILSELIEPYIGIDEPIFIYNFPISQASLAKKNVDDGRVADRFECYFRGIELVNGFCELTDPVEQLDRFIKDNQIRVERGLDEKAIDNRFIDALNSGLPNCSGVALGVDRLIMLALGKQKIDDVITFPIDRA